MPRVVVIGSTNVDLTFRVARLPRVGETLPGDMQTGFGGKGANQAVMAARLGAEVTMISAVGSDDFGARAIENYRRHGVHIAHVRRCDQPTGTAAILVDEDARNCIVVVPGANGALTVDDVRGAHDAIVSADVVLAQLETPIAATLAGFQLAREAGVRTVLNPAPALAVPDALLRLTDLCIPNETELETLTGRSVQSPAEAEAAAKMLLARGPATVVVTLGERGAMIVVPNGTEHCPSVPVQAVDPTAAGDAFIGAVSVFLAGKQPLVQAVHRACAVAALTVTRPGAQSSFSSLSEINAFLAAQRSS